jgi:membrane-bound lytic murein transglycosylase A
VKRRSAEAQKRRPCVNLFPVSCFLSCLWFLTVFFGCSRAVRPPLERLTPDHVPPFVDDLDRASLKAAVTQSLTALQKKEPTEVLAFGTEALSVAQVQQSLSAFLALLENEEELHSAVISNFDVYRVTIPVLFTGYHEPLLHGSRVRTHRYRYPLYQRPDDLVEIDLSVFFPKRAGEKLYGRVVNGKLLPYFSRAEIDQQGALEDKQQELIWVDDPIARFFLHIQGSGQIVLPDGSRVRVGYAASNGRPYRSIGKFLLDQGKLGFGQTSAPAIRRYLTAHPAEQDEIFAHNQRYIFFQPTADGPRGSLGVPLTPGRSLATDPNHYPVGALGFILTKRPVVNPVERISWQEVSRFVLLQDSGAAITGLARADLFWGSGADIEAGYMAQEGELYLLVKKP